MHLLSETLKLTCSQHLEAEHFYVAFSGGLDSRVLLHLCASLPLIRHKVTAVYVHHGLQAEADDWGEHCAETAKLKGFRFIKLHVDGRPEPGESGEEAARNARYRGLKSLLNNGDVLFTGQHREDQLETILLQLFRGGGLSGLSGMPAEAAFGKGKLIRPLLNISKRDIEEYAQLHDLTWVEDPSNRECDFDRNYLRNRVIPLLKERWPAIDKTVFRAGRHCAEAERRLSRISEELFRRVLDSSNQTLKLDCLQSFDRYDQQLVIREWFRSSGLRMPSLKLVDQVLDRVVAAGQARGPKLQTKDFTVRRYRDGYICCQMFIRPTQTAMCFGLQTKNPCSWRIMVNCCLRTPPDRVFQRKHGISRRLPYATGGGESQSGFQEEKEAIH